MEDKFKPTSEWMYEHYDTLNEQLFNGELGDCILRPFTTGKGMYGNTLGWFKITGRDIYIDRRTREMYQDNSYYGSKTYITEDNFVSVCKPTIELNANYSWTEHAMLATLAHEMCHYYTYMKGKAPKQGHGPEFYAIGSIVSSRSNGQFTIQRLASAEQMNEMELDADIRAKVDQREERKKSSLSAIVQFMRDCTIRLTTTTSSDVIDSILYSAKLHSDTVYKILKINDPSLIDELWKGGYKKNMRTYRYWNIENKPFAEHLNDYQSETLYENDNNRPYKPAETSNGKRMFRITTPDGETFETQGEIFFSLKKELENKFPDMKQKQIMALINDTNNYYRKLTESRLDRTINEAIKNFVDNISNDNEDIPISPDLNLGLMSPLEMENI